LKGPWEDTEFTWKGLSTLVLYTVKLVAP